MLNYRLGINRFEIAAHLMWLCVVASVCCAGGWLWKLLSYLDNRRYYSTALRAIGPTLGALLLWFGRVVLGSEAPRYE